MQYYGIKADRKTAAFVAMTKERVIEEAKKDKSIIYLADKFNILYRINEEGANNEKDNNNTGCRCHFSSGSNSTIIV